MNDSSSVPKLGIWAWSFVGFVVATIIVVTALGAVSEIVLPLVFAAVLAVIFKPLVGKLERRGLKPTLAAGLIVLGLLALMTVVLVATARGILEQKDESVPRSTRPSRTRATTSMWMRPRWRRPVQRPRRPPRRSPKASSRRWSRESSRSSVWPAA